MLNGKFIGVKEKVNTLQVQEYDVTDLLKEKENIIAIMVNGEEVGYLKTKGNKASFPLNEGFDAPDGGVICLPLKTEVDQDYEIKFYL